MKAEGLGLQETEGGTTAHANAAAVSTRTCRGGQPDAVGGGDHPAPSDVRPPTVDLLVLLQSDLPLDLRLHTEQAVSRRSAGGQHQAAEIM